MPRDSRLKTFLRTSSLVIGFSLRCGSLWAFAPSSNLMWYMQRSEIIPNKSERVHPMAFLFLLITSSSSLSCSSVKLLLTMTGNVSFYSRYAYMRPGGSVFNSFLGVLYYLLPGARDFSLSHQSSFPSRTQKNFPH